MDEFLQFIQGLQNFGQESNNTFLGLSDMVANAVGRKSKYSGVAPGGKKDPYSKNLFGRAFDIVSGTADIINDVVTLGSERKPPPNRTGRIQAEINRDAREAFHPGEKKRRLENEAFALKAKEDDIAASNKAQSIRVAAKSRQNRSFGSIINDESNFLGL